MKSASLGIRISIAEVTNISTQGFWVLIDDREIFAAFKHFPWFEQATIRQITQVERPSPHHLYWPELDIDLAVDSLDHPDCYPLVSKARSDTGLQLPGLKRGGRGPSAQAKDGGTRRTARS